MQLMPQVANFEYVDEAELAAEEETPVPPAENKASVNSSERASYWEDLLRDKYEVHKIEEFNAMGKGKRSRKQVCLGMLGILCALKFAYVLIVFTNPQNLRTERVMKGMIIDQYTNPMWFD